MLFQPVSIEIKTPRQGKEKHGEWSGAQGGLKFGVCLGRAYVKPTQGRGVQEHSPNQWMSPAKLPRFPQSLGFALQQMLPVPERWDIHLPGAGVLHGPGHSFAAFLALHRSQARGPDILCSPFSPESRFGRGRADDYGGAGEGD